MNLLAKQIDMSDTVGEITLFYNCLSPIMAGFEDGAWTYNRIGSDRTPRGGKIFRPTEAEDRSPSNLITDLHSNTQGHGR